MSVTFTVRKADPGERERILGVIETTGWGITRESVGAILDWDPAAYLIAEDPAAGEPLGVIFRLGYRRTGWLGHLIVRPECRGGGVGKALFGEALAEVRALGKSPVYLTATDLGQPIYEKFGFVVDGGWSRWRGVSPGPAALPLVAGELAAQPLQEADLAEVVAFDTARFGDDRGVVLHWLCREHPAGGRVVRRADGTVAGYFFDGTEGLGPCVADPEAARPLLREALALYAGRTLALTFPDANATAPELCREAGLEPFRTWRRMLLGDDPSPPQDDRIFNASVAIG